MYPIIFSARKPVNPYQRVKPSQNPLIRLSQNISDKFSMQTLHSHKEYKQNLRAYKNFIYNNWLKNPKVKTVNNAIKKIFPPLTLKEKSLEHINQFYFGSMYEEFPNQLDILEKLAPKSVAELQKKYKYQPSDYELAQQAEYNKNEKERLEAWRENQRIYGSINGG
jgi:hypothetical protein